MCQRPNAAELSCGAECELLNQTAWVRRQLQLLVMPQEQVHYDGTLASVSAEIKRSY